MLKNIAKKSALVAVALSLTTTQATASATGMLSDYYSNNGIGLWMDRTATAGGNNCDSSGNSSSLPGENNIEKAFNYFTGKGLSHKQAAGIVGNFMWEAPGPPAVNPKQSQGGGGPGRGIAQWSVGGRWDTEMFGDKIANIKKYAEKMDKEMTDLGLQLDFVWYEMNEIPPWKNALDPLKKTSTVEEAARVFMTEYEKPNPDPRVARLDMRTAHANSTYNKYKDNPAGGVASPQSGTECDTYGTGTSIVEVAKKELSKGVVEIPPGCDGDNRSRRGSCGKEVDKYTDNHLEYWCADFASWVYKTAGKEFTGGVSGGWRIASAENIQSFFEKSKDKRKRTFFENGPSANPQPGDVYIINNGQHVGIVIEVKGNTLYTISGNTSVANYRNGSGVGDYPYRDFRSNTNITGFGGFR